MDEKPSVEEAQEIIRQPFSFLFKNENRWFRRKKVSVLVVREDFYVFDVLVKKGTVIWSDERIGGLRWSLFRYLDLALKKENDVWRAVGFLPMRK